MTLILQTFKTSLIPNHKSYRADILRECSLPTLTCHVSHVMCLVSCVIFHLIFFFKLFLSKWILLLVEGLLSMGLPCLVSSLRSWNINLALSFWIYHCYSGIIYISCIVLNHLVQVPSLSSVSVKYEILVNDNQLLRACRRPWTTCAKCVTTPSLAPVN